MMDQCIGGHPRLALTDTEVDAIARVAHDANAAYCRTIGDPLQAEWNFAPDWQKRSARNGVIAVAEGRAQTGEQSHNCWLEEKLRDGWRYGEVKDEYAKTHPCLLPYASLPPEQKFKDDLFRGVVNIFLHPKVDAYFRSAKAADERILVAERSNGAQ